MEKQDNGTLRRTVSVPAKGLAVFIKDGDKLVQLHPKPKEEAGY